MKVFLALSLCLLSFAACALGQAANTVDRRDVPILVSYKIEHPDSQCTNATPPFEATVSVDPVSNVLRVMQRAVGISTQYRFKATYFGDTLGFSIDEINGVASSYPCFWKLYIVDPNKDEFLAQVGASSFFIPGNGYWIIWRFEDIS